MCNIIYKIKNNINSKVNKMGKNHPKHKGEWCTPWGKFLSSKEAATNLVSASSIKNYCGITYSYKKIDKLIISHSKYLTEDMVGKTFKDVGFYFNPL